MDPVSRRQVAWLAPCPVCLLLYVVLAGVYLSACDNALPPVPLPTPLPTAQPTPASVRLAVSIGDYTGSYEFGHNSVYEAIDGDLSTGWTSVHKAVG